MLVRLEGGAEAEGLVARRRESGVLEEVWRIEVEVGRREVVVVVGYGREGRRAALGYGRRAGYGRVMDGGKMVVYVREREAQAVGVQVGAAHEGLPLRYLISGLER